MLSSSTKYNFNVSDEHRSRIANRLVEIRQAYRQRLMGIVDHFRQFIKSEEYLNNQHKYADDDSIPDISYMHKGVAYTGKLLYRDSFVAYVGINTHDQTHAVAVLINGKLAYMHE